MTTTGKMNQFKLYLAPMERITSNAFRTVCYRQGADLTFTEQSRVESLVRNNKSTVRKIELHDDTPTIIQLLGSKEKHFQAFLQRFQPTTGFTGFNLNLGCPGPEIIRLGQGCAMIRKINKTKLIVNIFHEYSYPISIKMRLGLNQKDKENKVYLHLIENVDADYFIVHARHGTQTYRDPADFSVYEECVKTGKEIIANGDIVNKKQVDYLQSLGLNGAMIGRAAVANPTIFNELKGNIPTPISIIKEQYLTLAEQFKEPVEYRNLVLKMLSKN